MVYSTLKGILVSEGLSSMDSLMDYIYLRGRLKGHLT